MNPGRQTHAELHSKLLEVDGMIVPFNLVCKSCCFLEQVRMLRFDELAIGIGLEEGQLRRLQDIVCKLDLSYLI